MIDNEIIANFSELDHMLREAGVKYDLKLVVLNDSEKPSIYCSTSDHVFKRQSMEIAYLEDGGHRLIQHRETVYPPDANKHPENARVIKCSVEVDYIQASETTGLEPVVSDYFKKIENLFIY